MEAVEHSDRLDDYCPAALLSVAVDSLAACEALLAKNGVKAVKPDAGRLIVPPAEAAHLTLEFRERW